MMCHILIAVESVYCSIDKFLPCNCLEQRLDSVLAYIFHKLRRKNKPSETRLYQLSGPFLLFHFLILSSVSGQVRFLVEKASLRWGI